jgi:hypothetical protein
MRPFRRKAGVPVPRPRRFLNAHSERAPHHAADFLPAQLGALGLPGKEGMQIDRDILREIGDDE